MTCVCELYEKKLGLEEMDEEEENGECDMYLCNENDIGLKVGWEIMR